MWVLEICVTCSKRKHIYNNIEEINVSRDLKKSELGIEPWTSCNPAKRANNYTVRFKYQENLKSLSRLRCLNWYLSQRQTNAFFFLYIKWTIVLYCINGVVIAVQCAATFLRAIVLPEFIYLGRELYYTQKFKNRLTDKSHRTYSQSTEWGLFYPCSLLSQTAKKTNIVTVKLIQLRHLIGNGLQFLLH